MQLARLKPKKANKIHFTVRLSPDRIQDTDDLVTTVKDALPPLFAERISRAAIVGASIAHVKKLIDSGQLSVTELFGGEPE
jgi:hypothetical protein